ncbi:AAC(3) family N-acetyltransferase [Lujinxingia litoralis]|uniref:Aminoglycoside N(3)-acetyltransferase n=1 Tax=Lujinxingia litoralis TaxID=2211119 RepID=A0A328C994_9DELT|nr:AAC(3) family N-acetyltransferase [Lujinxingia litoralis]RAL22735.1 AAC(3) family N-acetyltransferase [Lujinxingia litoralis]
MSQAALIRRTPHPHTRDSLASELRALGLTPGMNLLVHCSMRRIGFIVGGAQTLLLALLDAIGPQGTLMVPTHTSFNTDPARWENPPVPADWVQTIRDHTPAFDPQRTPSNLMGQLAELVRTCPDARRSPHPVGSFAALGPAAATLVDHHPLLHEFGETSPLARHYDLDGHVLLLGVGHERNTSLHLAEHRADFPAKSTISEGCAMLVDGQRAWVSYPMLALDTDDFPRLGRDFEAAHASPTLHIATIGGATARLIHQPTLVDFATDWMELHRHPDED